jgi:hypothetical protein
MNDAEKLIAAIEAKTVPIGDWMKLSTGPMVQVSDVIDLINSHMEGNDEQARKAELWDGLLSSGRIRILGTAGMGSPEGEYRHFGMEIWSSYGKKGEYDFDKDNEYGKAVLEKYASSTYKAMLSTQEVKEND